MSDQPPPLPLSKVGPCRMACRALAAAYRAEWSGRLSGAHQSRYEWYFSGLDDREKERVARFQERIERLRRKS